MGLQVGTSLFLNFLGKGFTLDMWDRSTFFVNLVLAELCHTKGNLPMYKKLQKNWKQIWSFFFYQPISRACVRYLLSITKFSDV